MRLTLCLSFYPSTSFPFLPLSENMAASRTTLVSLVVATMLIELAMAASYNVGGPNGGWDSTTDLQTWASSQTFLVGDNLSKLFTHTKILTRKWDNFYSDFTYFPVQELRNWYLYYVRRFSVRTKP